MSAESPSESDDDGHTESPEEREQRILRAVRREWMAALNNPEVSKMSAFFFHHIVTTVCKDQPDITGAEVYKVIHLIDDGKVGIEDEKG